MADSNDDIFEELNGIDLTASIEIQKLVEWLSNCDPPPEIPEITIDERDFTIISNEPPQEVYELQEENDPFMPVSGIQFIQQQYEDISDDENQENREPEVIVVAEEEDQQEVEELSMPNRLAQPMEFNFIIPSFHTPRLTIRETTHIRDAVKVIRDIIDYTQGDRRNKFIVRLQKWASTQVRKELPRPEQPPKEKKPKPKKK